MEAGVKLQPAGLEPAEGVMDLESSSSKLANIGENLVSNHVSYKALSIHPSLYNMATIKSYTNELNVSRTMQGGT